MIVSGVILPALPAERMFGVRDGDAGFKDNHWHWFHGRIWTSFRSCVMLAVATLTHASRHDILLRLPRYLLNKKGPILRSWAVGMKRLKTGIKCA